MQGVVSKDRGPQTPDSQLRIQFRHFYRKYTHMRRCYVWRTTSEEPMWWQHYKQKHAPRDWQQGCSQSKNFTVLPKSAKKTNHGQNTTKSTQMQTTEPCQDDQLHNNSDQNHYNGKNTADDNNDRKSNNTNMELKQLTPKSPLFTHWLHEKPRAGLEYDEYHSQ